MNYLTKLIAVSTTFIIATSLTLCRDLKPKGKEVKPDTVKKGNVQPMIVYIIVGSTRHTKTGLKIAKNIKSMIDKRSDVKTEIVDIADYGLPFYTDEISPSSRKEEITDPTLKKWSDKIKQADGYIIVAPEYNSGYPASLKNALDSLYTEWNNKPISFVGYSGGPSGGASMISQLRDVARALKMVPITADIKIPQSWKSLDHKDCLANSDEIEKEINVMVDQLVEAQIVSTK